MSMCRVRITAIFVAAVLTLGAGRAGAQLIAYDGFGNGPLANLAGSTGGTGWASAWMNAGTDLTKVAGTGLSHPGLATTGGGAVTPPASGVFPSSVYRRSYAIPAGAGAVYVSFLMRDDAAWGSWGGVSFGTYPYEMTVGSPLGWYSYGMMLSEGLGDVTNKPLIQGETTLVVVKISKNAGTGITYRMYLNPIIGGSEPSFADAMYGVAPVSSLPAFLQIDNGTGFTTDEIRVGSSWAAVLPAQPNAWTDLGFAKPGVSGAPHLTGVGSLQPNSVNQISLTNARPLATATLVFGFTTLNAPFLGGTLVPQPTLVVPLVTDAVGAIQVAATLPPDAPAGVTLRFQYWIEDPAATLGLSASNGLGGVTH